MTEPWILQQHAFSIGELVEVGVVEQAQCIIQIVPFDRAFIGVLRYFVGVSPVRFEHAPRYLKLHHRPVGRAADDQEVFRDQTLHGEIDPPLAHAAPFDQIVTSERYGPSESTALARECFENVHAGQRHQTRSPATSSTRCSLEQHDDCADHLECEELPLDLRPIDCFHTASNQR
ncbi:hypothetical protein HRV97_16695 [Sphingomonas sp. HHU CXW]|uniref:Uncharacterized protein n=1 Tax=Sphingomonas hominis TaxID=2741495 RepID=A0ABX2JMT2_9SPHN|nr:hypothetical protein [Sphingomonas hominis]NTS66780.1 hypothetical protein [Sphingomonas hominis]